MYGPQDFKIGEEVKIYTTNWGYSKNIEVRVGVVLRTDYAKKAYMSIEPSLKLQLKKIGKGKTIDEKTELKDSSAVQNYPYRNIGLVERL